MNYGKWMEKNAGRLDGKTAAISGATGGLGRELCRHFATLGAALVLIDRNPKKQTALIGELMSEHPNLAVRGMTADMEDMDSVKRVAAELLASPPDFLILNAGAYHIPRHKTGVGYDNVFTINFIAPYYLAKTLKSTLEARGGRVIAVSSIAHNYSKTDPEDIDFSKREKSSKVYGNAKRYLTFALYHLFKDSDSLAIAHPGITFTGITAHYPKLIFALIKHPMKVIFMKPKKAALPIVKGVFIPCRQNEWLGPRLFGIWGKPKKTALATCGEAESAAIFEIAETIFDEIQ